MSKLIHMSCIVLLITHVLYAFFGVLYAPMRSMDTIGIWMLKAKAIHVEKGFPSHFLHTQDYTYSHQQYPLLLPTIFTGLNTFFTQNTRGFHPNIYELPALLLSPLCYLFILLLVYRTIRSYTPKTPALFLTCVYSALSPLLGQAGRGHAGNADIYLVLCSWIIIALLTRKKHRSHTYVWIAVVVAVASQIKMEGIFLISSLAFLPMMNKKKYVLFFIAFLPTFLWMTYVRVTNIPTDLFYNLPTLPIFFSRLSTILFLTIREMAHIQNWFLFWIVFWCSLFVHTQQTFLASIAGKTLLAMSLIYLALYLCSTLDAFSYVSSSIDRVLLHLSPWAFIYMINHLRVFWETPLSAIPAPTNTHKRNMTKG